MTTKFAAVLMRSVVALLMVMIASLLALHQQAGGAPSNNSASVDKVWIHGGFEDFTRGRFDDAGSNLYVNVRGAIEMINNWDVNGDGYPDLVLANTHDYVERGPTRVFASEKAPGSAWRQRDLSADSGWMSRIVDADGDGFVDLLIANGENGVSSVLSSYVYWGGEKGVGTGRTEFPTVGAYDVLALDINRDGRLDLIFPSAWTDHHNPGRTLPVRVYLQEKDRKFRDASQQYNITGVAALSIAAADLNQDGFPDLVLANYRSEHDLDTDSLVYWGTAEGVNAHKPLHLPTHGAQQVLLADLDHDGLAEVIFSGADEVRIYWNRQGKLGPAACRVIKVLGYSSMFSQGTVRAAVADVDGDGRNDLILATLEGVQIRTGTDIGKIVATLPVKQTHWVTASDLDGDGRPELIVSKYDDGVLYDTESAIFWNGPHGFSAERVSWVPTQGAVGNTAGDLDGDGRPEVVFNNTMSGHVHEVPSFIYLGNKEARYGKERRLELPSVSSYQAVVADLDLDGYPEVVFTTLEGLRIFQGTPHGPASDHFVDLPTQNKTLQDVRVADFNRDGYLDLLAVGTVYDTKPETLARSSTIFFGSKEGFSPLKSQSIENYGNMALLADVNRDGYLDVLFDDKRNFVLIYLGSKDGFSKDHILKVPCSGLVTSGTPNVADLNRDGWLDLIVSTMGHYTGLKDTLHIFYGGPQGFSPERTQQLLGGYSPSYTGVADFNRDGNLDLLVSAYSTQTTRVLPAQLFWGNGKTLDLDHPVNLPAESSGAVTQIDLNRDGWTDIVLACHRNNVGHQVDSLIYWNGPAGFSPDRVTRLPGLGPHGMTSRDRGNAYTREPEETYVSPAFNLQDRTAARIHWKADGAPPLQLRFQLRWAASPELLEEARWMGPKGEGTYFSNSGQAIHDVPSHARWLQYRAVFVSPYGCGSPKLHEVRVDLRPK